jgi:predicted glycosyltransferase
MRVWVDCTAAAHPLVLRPIIERLQAGGHEVEVTTRDYGQTVGIFERLGIAHQVVGSHVGGATARKAVASSRRSAALWSWARGRRFDLALAHGSVELALVAAARRVPSAQMQDYEWAGLQRRISWRLARRVIVPDAIPVARLVDAGARRERLFRYPGLKEDYYLSDFVPDDRVLAELGLTRDPILVVVRPPPETSAYHEPNSLYERLLDRLVDAPDTTAVVIPRTDSQADAVRRRGEGSLLVPAAAIDAQSLIAYADLVVSAGGTMNREAVALGVPVRTIFSGRLGAVDEALIDAGRMRPLTDPDELELIRRPAAEIGPMQPRDPALLVDAVLEAAG